MHRVTLYTRPGCHLCSAAGALLCRLEVDFDELNIDADAALHARYTDRVPIVAVDGRELLEGRISERAARAALAPFLGRSGDRGRRSNQAEG